MVLTSNPSSKQERKDAAEAAAASTSEACEAAISTEISTEKSYASHTAGRPPLPTDDVDHLVGRGLSMVHFLWDVMGDMVVGMLIDMPPTVQGWCSESWFT